MLMQKLVINRRGFLWVCGGTVITVGSLGLIGCGDKGNVLEPTKRDDVPMSPNDGPIVMTLSLSRAGTERVGSVDVPLIRVVFGGNLSFPIQPPFDWSKERLRKVELYNYSGAVPEKGAIEVNNGSPDMDANTSRMPLMRAYGNKLKVSLYLETELMDVSRTPGRKEWHPFREVAVIQADGVRERIPITTSPDNHPMLDITVRSNAQVEVER
jgi:hypothetical protein